MSRSHRLPAVLLVLGGCCLAMSGCANPARDRMIGDWEASFEMTDDEVAKSMPSDNPIVAGLGKVLMKSFAAKIQWNFAADNTMTVSGSWLGNTWNQQGSWRFVSGDEKSTTLQIQLGQRDPIELEFAFSDPDTCAATALSIGDMQINRSVTFKRAVSTP